VFIGYHIRLLLRLLIKLDP